MGTINLVVKHGINYILETNGILLDDSYINELQKYKNNIFLYYSLKGINPKYFNLITDCDNIFWFRQLKNLRKLVDKGFTIGINTMIDFYQIDSIRNFIYLLNSIHDSLPLAVDIKTTSLFPHVNKRIIEKGIMFDKKYTKQMYFKLLLEIFPDVILTSQSNQIILNNMTFYKFGLDSRS